MEKLGSNFFLSIKNGKKCFANIFDTQYQPQKQTLLEEK